MTNVPLQEADEEIWQAIQNERGRQQDGLEMIASENYTSPAVMAAQGDVLTNKYAEGLPGKRYYGGCEFADVAERLAIDRLMKLFGAEFANVQPHSGAQANHAVYFAALDHGDKILAMDLAHGGHLTHGMHLNYSGKHYKVQGYGVRQDTERIDFDQVAKMAQEHRPKMIVAGASAYPREIDFARFREIADDVRALLFVDMAHIAGLVAGGQHQSPIPHADFVTTTTHKTLRGPRGGAVMAKAPWAKKINSAVFPGLQGGPLMHVIAAKAVAFKEALKPDFKTYAQNTITNAQTLAEELKRKGFRIVSGGTDNHLLLVDVASRSVTGKTAEEALDRAGITVNKNKIPFDPRPPMEPSGIRIGTPALTTRGMGPKEMAEIAVFIDRVLTDPTNAQMLESTRGSVRDMAHQFPLPY